MVVLLRYAEVGLKGKNRPFFEKQLSERVRTALRPLEARVRREHGRLFVESDAPWPRLKERLARVFGVVSFSPVRVASLDLPDIERAAALELGDAAAGRDGTVSFKVNARRANKGFDLTSLELNRRLGRALLEGPPDGVDLRVDVHRPEVTLTVEVRDRAAYVYARTCEGPGGLPVGSGGRALALLSGGIDSPVAIWLTMKRGVTVDAVHFHSHPFTSERSREKVVDLGRVLAGYGSPLRLHVVHFTEVQTAIGRDCPPALGITVMRRMMFRIAERLAARAGALGLVTGESIGQVASQTLESIRTIGEVTSMPVFRPLTGLDKAEIVDLARRVGTYETSILPYEDCCTLFVHRSPSTRPRPGDARAAEEPLQVEALVEGAVERTETLTLQA